MKISHFVLAATIGGMMGAGTTALWFVEFYMGLLATVLVAAAFIIGSIWAFNDEM